LAISINQDPTEQGKLIKAKNNGEVWVKNLKGGKYAVLLINRDNEKDQTVELSLSDLKNSGEYVATEVYSGDDLGKITSSFSKTLAPQSGLFLLVEPK